MSDKEEKVFKVKNPGELKIALVGSPNVGKSTFFNKLIGGRRSIVEDMPGVTRDRLYAKVNLSRWSNLFDGIKTTVIDTGGLFFKDETLYQGVQKQAYQAMDEADCVILITDGRVGMTAVDRAIAEELRGKQNSKPVFLLVNKLDDDSMETMAAEFYNLAIGEPIPFSARGGHFNDRMDLLLSKIYDSFDFMGKADRTTEEEPIKVAIIGKPNVGKSSLLNRIVGYERALVHDEAGTTRDCLDTEFTYKHKKFLLIDTAGMRRKSKVFGGVERFSVERSIKAIVRADIGILVIDATEGVSHQEQKLANLIQSKGKACIVVLNKWDLVPKTNESFKEHSERIMHELGFVSYAPLVVTSASTGQRVLKILDTSVKVHECYNRRVSTGLLNNVIREIVSINEPAKSGAKNLKIYYCTQVEKSPPTFTLFVNDPKQMSDNYLKFLERCIRKEFDFEGSPLIWKIKKSGEKSNQS
jgi:GTP-binding protein